jgi:hypothetical protein
MRSERFVVRYSRQTAYGPQIVAAVAFDMPLELLRYRDQIGRALPHSAAAGRRGHR